MNARAGSLLRSFLALLGSFLKHLWVPGSTLGVLWAHFLNQTSVWGSKGAPRGATPEIKSPFWTHFGTPKIIKQKVSRTVFMGGPEMVPKTGPHSGSQKVRVCCYLLHLSKVRRLRNGPILGAVWGPVFYKIRKNEQTEDTQK